MTEQKHTPEPWRIGRLNHWREYETARETVGPYEVVVDTDNGVYVLASCNYNFPQDAIANARRIVACVNACAGLDTEYLETVGLPEFAGKQLCADIAQQELDAVIAERDRLRSVCAEAYQFAGAYDAPVEVLDNLSAAANGLPLPHESFLPVDDSEAVAQRDQLRAALERAADALEREENLWPWANEARDSLAATE